VLFVSNGPGNDPHNPALGRILLEQDITVVSRRKAELSHVAGLVSGVLAPFSRLQTVAR